MEKVGSVLTPEELVILKTSMIEDEKIALNEYKSASLLLRAQEEKDYPYLREYRLVTERYNTVISFSDAEGIKWVTDHLEAFTAKAETFSLTIDQAMMASHLFGCQGQLESAAKTLIFLYLSTPLVDRVKVHNCIILSKYDEHKRRSMGDRAVKCSLPLYTPVNSKLRLLNERILESMDSVEGGDTSETEKHFFATEKIHGGDYCERVIDSSGQQVYAVQMTETDARLNQIATMIQTMLSEKQTKRNNNNYNANNGRGGYNRGGYRGSRGGRGGAYGGSAPTDEELSKN